MKAMILAAGKGTRVRPLTYELPKPMIPILGKPVMAYMVEHMQKSGVKEIMVNVSYLHEHIQRYFGDGRRFGVEIGYSFEGDMRAGEILPHPMGSAGGMRKIQDFSGFFDSTTLVFCGDAIVDLDIGAALAEHRQKGAMVSLIAKQVQKEKVSEYGIVVTDQDGRITSFQEKPSAAEAKSDLANTGIYIFEPEVMELIPKGRFFDIGSELFPMLVERGLPFFAQKQNFNWIDIGRVSDYWEVTQSVLNHPTPLIPIPGKPVREGVWTGLNVRIDPSARITGPVYIGSGTSIERNAEIIGPAWIGVGCHVQRGGRIVRSILFEYTRVGQDFTFEDMIVCGDYCADRNGQMMHVDDERCELIWCDAREQVVFPVEAGVQTRI